MTDISEQQQKHIHNLLLSDDFIDLCAMGDEFNIFRVLKLQNNEVKHSNFLGWLLTPFESHHLQDLFLKEILKIALNNLSDCNAINTTVTDVLLNNLMDAKVKLEKVTNEGRRIDIFIDCPSTKLLCVIENKIWSGEGCNQLEDYETYINSHEIYKNYDHKIFIFLTPNDDYDCTKLYKNYIRLNYKEVFKAIENLLKRYGLTLDDNVRYFIEDYKKMIERDIMGIRDKKLDSLCRKIYRENRNAINLIMESVSSSQQEIDSILENIINKNAELNLEPSVKYWKRFTPKEVDFTKLNFAKETDDMESKKIIVLEFNNYDKEQLCVDIIVRTTDDQDKYKKVLDIAKKHFSYNGKTKYYAHVYSCPLIKNDEYYDFISSEDIENNIEATLLKSGIIEKFKSFAKEISDKL